MEPIVWTVLLILGSLYTFVYFSMTRIPDPIDLGFTPTLEREHWTLRTLFGPISAIDRHLIRRKAWEPWMDWQRNSQSTIYLTPPNPALKMKPRP